MKLYTGSIASDSDFIVTDAVYGLGKEGSGDSIQSVQPNQSSPGIQSSVNSVTWPPPAEATLNVTLESIDT